MKLSVSMAEDEVAFIDTYASEHGVGSRSEVVQRAIGLLRAVELGADYEAAWAEWDSADEAGAWDAAVADGLR